MDDTSLLQVERQRRELENSISKLRKSLQHWQTWEIEYEGLREEIAGLPRGSNQDDILATAREFRAELVDEKELQTIVGGGQRSSPTQAQIVDLLAKRVSYVTQNARSIEKQLSDAQKKRNVLLLAEEPDYREDAGLPLTDITEELDDDGNVVGSKVETPDSTAPKLVDVLRKAGVKDLFEQGGIVTASEGLSNTVSQSKNDLAIKQSAATETLRETEDSIKKTGDGHEQPFKRKSQDTGFEDPSMGVGKITISEGRKESEIEIRMANEGHTVFSLDESVSAKPRATNEVTGEIDAEETSILRHNNDTLEEAALRREMIQYSLGEVGSIVAELDLMENGSEVSYDEDGAALSFDSDLDENDIEEEDESEDENGMVKHPAMSKKYLEKMKELETRHGLKAMQNLGPDASRLPREIQDELDRPSAAAAARKAALARDAEAKDMTVSALKQDDWTSSKPKKKVAFAEDLDVATEAASRVASKNLPKNRPEALKLSEPVKDCIVERQSSFSSSNMTPSVGQEKSRKPSKFKAAREATHQTPLLPTFPSSQLSEHPSTKTPKPIEPRHNTHATTIVERDITSTNPHPPSSDDLDEAIHRQEIAGEYYKLRNRMIQRQGGFVSEGQADNYGEEITPLPMIDEDGKEKKISRFKAARLK